MKTSRGSTHLLSLLVLFALLASLVLLLKFIPLRRLLPSSAAPSNQPTVGAIRFDAWSNNDYSWFPNGGFRRLYSDYLSPEMWHYRLPFFAQIISSNQIAMNENNQSVLDQEIQAAHNAGLSYWAFDFSDLWWQSNPPTLPNGNKPNLNYALKLYLASQYKSLLNFSLIAFYGEPDPTLGPSSYWRQSTVAKLVKYAQDPAYQKVLSNRPLIFIFNAGGFSKKADLDYLRQQFQKAGLGNPYLVGMVWNPADPVIKNLGFDAASAYSAPQLGPANFTSGLPFSQLITDNTSFRNKAMSAGYQVIPIVNTGWDRRPHWIDPEEGHNIWYDRATPSQIAQNLKNALDWNKANPLYAQSNTILIYAWNEYTEGGWLGPSLLSGNDRLNAIASVLHPGNRPPPNPTPTPTPVSPRTTSSTIDDTNLSYAGSTWHVFANSTCGLVGGSWQMSSTTGDSASFTFTGSQVSILPVKQSNRGIANIYIDNIKVGSLDEYASSLVCNQWSSPFSASSYGSHKVKIIVSGTKNSASSGFNIAIDAIRFQ